MAKFAKTVATAVAVIKALDDPSLGKGAYNITSYSSAPASNLRTFGGSTMRSGGSSRVTGHCLAQIVANSKGVASPYGSDNTANLLANTPGMKAYRNRLRAAGFSANRLAEAQAAYENALGHSAGKAAVAKLVAGWYASASAYFNGGSPASVVTKLLK